MSLLLFPFLFLNPPEGEYLLLPFTLSPCIMYESTLLTLTAATTGGVIKALVSE